MSYNFTAIEKKWQSYWLTHKTFAALDPVDAGDMPKAYILDMFPYPSGAGLHVGHPEGYTATDIVSRFRRMQGYNVLHPMGWDAFGLPAEQYAVKNNVHPAITTKKNIENFRRQIQMLGLSYDWDREVDTTDPGYYKWTQWIFLQLFNSYFDPIQDRAMPISHLMKELLNENLVIGPDNSLHPNRTPEGMERISGEMRIERLWRELTAAEQREAIDAQRLAYIDRRDPPRDDGNEGAGPPICDRGCGQRCPSGGEHSARSGTAQAGSPLCGVLLCRSDGCARHALLREY